MSPQNTLKSHVIQEKKLRRLKVHRDMMSWSKSFCMGKGFFLLFIDFPFETIGSIYHLYTTYILPSRGLYNPYHLLPEPEKSIEIS